MRLAISSIKVLVILFFLFILTSITIHKVENIKSNFLFYDYKSYSISGFVAETGKNSGFEGKIKLKEIKQYDTVNYVIYTRKNMARIDKFAGKKFNYESLIFNLSNNTLTALQHQKKMFTNVPVQTPNNKSDLKLSVNKTGNTKIISGYKCEQWRVKNLDENTEITYWVANENFSFYKNLIKLWNRTDRCSKYFLNMPGSTGYLPLLQVERSLLRDVRHTIAIEDITFCSIDSTFFTTPGNYKPFRN